MKSALTDHLCFIKITNKHGVTSFPVADTSCKAVDIKHKNCCAIAFGLHHWTQILLVEAIHLASALCTIIHLQPTTELE